MKRLRHPIRAIREPFGTAGLILAMVALVAALGGSAIAAKGALTGKQKKEVAKIAKKEAKKYAKAGAEGKQGPTGPAGANGKDGAAGASGGKGDKGDPGTTGTNGTNGTNGTDGTDGESPVMARFAGDEEPTGAGCEAAGGIEFEVESTGESSIACNGATGQDAGFDYVFSSSTAATDPGAGKVAVNAAGVASATKLSISTTADGGASEGLKEAIKGWLSSPSAAGNILIRKVGEPSTYVQYEITGLQANNLNQKVGGAYNIIVTAVSSSGTFVEGDPVTVAYWASAAAKAPVGTTAIGTWAVSGTEAENGEGNPQEGILVPISFPVPLKSIARDHVFFPGDAGWAAHCEFANAESPRVVSAKYEVSEGVFALQTTMCFFTLEGAAIPLHPLEFINVWTPGLEAQGVGKSGGVLQFKATAPGLAYAAGAWAVQIQSE